MATEPQSMQVVRPTLGPWKYRRTCGLSVSGGALVVTDQRGRTHRFPFDGTEEAPSRYIQAMHDSWWMILDQRNRAIVKAETSDWDWREIADLIEPFGATLGVAPNVGPEPELRHDAVELARPAWAFWGLAALAAAGSLAFAVNALLQNDVIPVWAGIAFYAAVLITAVACIRGGVFAPARRSKSTPHIEAMLAEYEAKEAVKKAKEDRWERKQRTDG